MTRLDISGSIRGLERFEIKISSFCTSIHSKASGSNLSKQSLMELVFYFSSLLLLLLLSSQGLCSTQGRPLHLQPKDHPKIYEGVAMAEALIGSRPPRCEGKRAPCGRCEAVQVPVAPRRVDRGEAGRLFRDAGDRVDESSTNYKPLNWRCRCAGRRARDP